MEITAPTAECIRLKMNGRVSKTSPGPSPGAIPAENTAGITAKPASSAKARSDTSVPIPDVTIFSSSGA